MRSPRTIMVDMSDRNGTRWSSPNWLKADLARITSMSGVLPLNHLTKRLPTYMGFNAWLEATVSPDTHDYIMANESAFNMSLTAYLNLARFQAYNMNTNRESYRSAESNVNEH